MALRETGERHRFLEQIVRPAKPPIDAEEHHLRHHAVHTAICWMHELTDAPLEDLHDEFAGTVEGDLVEPDRLRELAELAMQRLIERSDHFSAADYASIYSHLQQGLTAHIEG